MIERRDGWASHMLNAGKVTFLAFLTLTLAGCSCMRRELTQTRSFLEAELKPGDPHERIEEVLRKAGVDYVYDPYANRYEGAIRADRCRNYSMVSVTINLDSSERMSGMEVVEIFTGCKSWWRLQVFIA
jgi:hypothetical protein